MVDEEAIRIRAYWLWEKEGRPPGRDAIFWQAARIQLEAEAEAARNRPRPTDQPAGS